MKNMRPKRLSVIPGITGLWQVSPARKSEIHDNPEYDLLYIDQRDLSLRYSYFDFNNSFCF